MQNNKQLLLVFGIVLVFLVAGCTNNVPIPIIKDEEAAISSSMKSAEKLLDFQEQGDLASFVPKYQMYSNSINAACEKLDTFDKLEALRNADSKIVCKNKKSIDNCFFQLEKIKSQIKNNDTEVNLDSLDALCSDLRSIGLQNKLDNFKTQYKDYTAWLKGEGKIVAEWELVSKLFGNSSETGKYDTKISDFYRTFGNDLATVKVSLQNIDKECVLKNDFKATNDQVEKICSNIDDYLSDVSEANTIGTTIFSFFSGFESGTITIGEEFIGECKQVSDETRRLSNLKLINDANPNATKTDLTSFCSEMENLTIIYSRLGIPLVLKDGELSSSTKIELLKSKTVYIENGLSLGSGVILSSDDSGYYILTNAHVVLIVDPDTGTKHLPTYARIKFHDGKIGYANQLAYTQEEYDLAVLYVPSSGYYPTAVYYGDYYPSAGDDVVAVGNPYGLEFSVTKGTVSGMRDGGCDDNYCYGIMIQTDTAINPGNSGGGLWDYDTLELLGINSLGYTNAQGLNFAISMYQFNKIKDTFKWYDI